MATVKVLWVSRHVMTSEQLAQLDIHAPFWADMDEDGGVDVEVVHINVTLPARGEEASEALWTLCEEHGAHLLTGVFPAHVAARLCRDRIEHSDTTVAVGMPVSVPAPAVEGEVRGGGFIHSHWEWIGQA